MTNDEIARLRALCEEAAPGPWGSGNGFVWVDSGHAAGDPDAPDTRIAYDVTGADAKFIAAARTALPAALDEIERLRGVLVRISIGHHSGAPENDALAWLESERGAE